MLKESTIKERQFQNHKGLAEAVVEAGILLIQGAKRKAELAVGQDQNLEKGR